jgi:hypothetical protein
MQQGAEVQYIENGSRAISETPVFEGFQKFSGILLLKNLGLSGI